MAWGKGGNLVATIQGKEDAAKVLTSRYEAAQTKFATAHGDKPDAYIRKAVVAAYRTTGKDQGYTGRSESGQRHSNNVSPSSSRDPLVVQYHDEEDEGKRCAQKGDVDGAITAFDNAAALRQDYERRRNLAPDQEHLTAIRVLTTRRASLSNLKINLQTNDAGVVAAKLLVRNFYQAEGLVSPYG